MACGVKQTRKFGQSQFGAAKGGRMTTDDDSHGSVQVADASSFNCEMRRGALVCARTRPDRLRCLIRALGSTLRFGYTEPMSVSTVAAERDKERLPQDH